MKKLLLLLVVLSATDTTFCVSPRFEKGILDLRGIKESDWKDIKLEGEWEFYWEKLLSPADFRDAAISAIDYIHVPGVWSDKTVGDKRLPAYGYATYRVRIITDSVPDRLAVKLASLGTAATFYADGRVLFTAGRVGRDKEETIPGYHPGVFGFTPTNDTTELIVQISNFHYARGGFWYNFTQFGREEEVRKTDNKRTRFSMFLLGAMLVFAVYLLVQYLKNRQFIYFLFFSLGCLFIGLRTTVVNETLILSILPGLSWNYLIRLEYLTMPGNAMVFLLFLYFFYPDEINKRVMQLLIVSAAILCIVPFISQPLFFTRYINIYLMHILLAVIYVLIVVVKALARKRDGAVMFLLGFGVLALTFINDLLYTKEIIQTGYQSSWGFIAFVISLSIMISTRYANLFKKETMLSLKLEVLNTELEKRVEERTSKIVEQNKLLIEKNEEIEKINQTKDKFFAIIAHDLKNPIGGINQLAALLDKDFDQFDETEKRTFVRHINESSGETYDLLKNLLDWALVQKGTIKYEPEQITIHSIIRRSTDLLGNNAIQKNLTIIVPPDNHQTAYADEEMVMTVFRNLLHNAIKFSAPGNEIIIKIEDDNDFWKISVQDNGIGLSEADKALLFNPGSDTRKIGKSKEKGTGLGLILCKEFIELNKGKIWVESKPSCGAVFIFTLPKA